MPSCMKTRFRYLCRLLLALPAWCCIFTSTPAQAPQTGTITLFVYPPSSRMDYDRPGKLVRRTMAVELKRALVSWRRVPFQSRFDGIQNLKTPYLSTIGHTICRISCQLPDETLYAHWASMSAKNYTRTALRLLTREGAGLGVLFQDYESGFILGQDENLQRLSWYRGPKTPEGYEAPRYIQFSVQAEQCAEIKAMVDFFEQYHPDSGLLNAPPDAPPAERPLYFTNMIDPYTCYLDRQRLGHGVMGGGCAPFGVALLKIAGLYDPALDDFWKRKLTISERLIRTPGGPKVSLLSLLIGRRSRSWQFHGYENRVLELYDPSKIWSFIVELEKDAQLLPPEETACPETEMQPNTQSGFAPPLPAGLIFRQGAPIVLPQPELIPHPKYPARPPRQEIRGIIIRNPKSAIRNP
jgi:hypothetical protein